MPAGIINDATEVISAEQLKKDFDAVILAAGSEVPRDLPIPGRELKGTYAALEFLIPQNKSRWRRRQPDQRQGASTSSSSAAAIPAPTALAPRTATALPR